MALAPIYPKRNLSRLGKAKYIHPYLLRNLEITCPNQQGLRTVWALNISHLTMKRGLIYLTEIMNLYSRYIVGWLSNGLEKGTQIELLYATTSQPGKQEIINIDQGAQYTCEHWVNTLNDLKIRINVDAAWDGKGRATDNAHIERWFRTIKKTYLSESGEKWP